MNEHAKVAHGCPPTRVAYVLCPLNASAQQDERQRGDYAS
jgi:hypothetical protein